MNRRWRDLFVCLVLGLLAVLAWPYSPIAGTGVYDIKITATGEKNARSSGSEVWLLSWPAGFDAESPPELTGWEERGAALVSYRDQPSEISFRGSLNRGGAFVFMRHGWSGRVAVTVNGTTRSHDLFASGGSESPLSISLREFPSLAGAPGTCWVSFGFLVLAAGFCLLVLCRLANRLAAHGPLPAAERPGDLLRYSIPAALIFVFVLLGTWPAQMSSDSVAQWWQLANGKLNNAHPAVHTILFGGPGYLLGSPGWSIAIQIALLSLSCGALAAETARWGVGRRGAWLLAVLVPALPAVHILATAFWKDVPYAAALAGLTAMLMAMARTNGAVLSRRGFVLTFLAAMFLVATLRHNGLLVAAGVTVLVALVKGRQVGARFIGAMAAAGVALPLVLSLAILPALGVANLGRHYGGAVPLHFLGGLAVADAIEDKDTLARLDDILPLEDLRRQYDCLNMVSVFWAPGIDYEKIDASLFRPAISAALNAPGAAARQMLCVNSSVWRLSPTEGAQHTLAPLGIWQATPPYDALGLKQMPVSALARYVIEAEFALTTGAVAPFVLFWRPAFMLFSILCACIYAFSRGSRVAKSVVLLCAPVLLNVMSMIPLTGSQDLRYQLAVYIVGPFLVCALVLLGNRRSPP